MDDGDILGLRPRVEEDPRVEDPHVEEDPRVEDHADVQCENLEDPRSEFLVQHCAGALNLNNMNSWSESNRHRYYLSTRTTIPLRDKLEEFIGDSREHHKVDESLLVLSTLAKIFIAKMVERIRIKNVSNPISKMDLLETNFNCLARGSAI